MSQRRQRLYRRLDRAERAAIERGLDKNRPARAMARDLGRSQSSVADEVRRNRTVTRGPGKGSRVESVPEGACARLRGWPHVCNGCNRRRYHCSMPFRCEYSAARAQLLADSASTCLQRFTVWKECSMAAVVEPAKCRVALLAGGTSGEREISLASGKGAGEALREAGFIVQELDPAKKDHLKMLIEEPFDRRVREAPRPSFPRASCRLAGKRKSPSGD